MDQYRIKALTFY